MTEIEDDIVENHQPKFYICYVDDKLNRCKKNQVDLLFNELNSYHENIKLILEVNPKRFLNTNLEFQNGILITVHHKETKLSIPWDSKISKNYKRK